MLCSKRIATIGLKSPLSRPSFVKSFVNSRSIHSFVRAQTKSHCNNKPKVYFQQRCHFSNKKNLGNELSFLVLRLAVRGFGQFVGYLWRSGQLRQLPLKKLLLYFGIPIAIGGGYVYYNSERVPYSNRLHFLWLDRDTELELSALGKEEIFEKEKGKFLSEKEEIYRVTKNIVDSLLRVCEEDKILTSREREQFSLHIIQSKIPNAFVLPDGTIFVYTGILPIAETEGGLACILGHEISHALAHHASEKIGITRLLILLYEFLRGLTDMHRSYTQIFFELIAVTMFQVGLPLAHSRAMEGEADRVGVKLAARAGFDPAQAAAVWERMMTAEHVIEQNQTTTQAVPEEHGGSALTTTQRLSELLSTHPCHERRIAELQAYAQVVRTDYDHAVDHLRVENLPVPHSKRYLPYPGVKQRAHTPFDYDYGWDERDLQSALLASHSASLMIGTQGEQIQSFLQKIGRSHVPWGGDH